MFVALYNGLFLHHFGRWPDGSIFLPIVWATWVLSSYVIGRYQGVDGLRPAAGAFIALQGLVKTTLVVALSLAGILTYFWLFKANAGDSLLRKLPDPVSQFPWLAQPAGPNLLGFMAQKKSV